MGVFRKSTGSSNSSKERAGKMKLTKDDRDHLKLRTASVHDPILAAVNEAQPFEQAADIFNENGQRNMYGGATSQGIKDVFGRPIAKPDISNPTRARDERPLDTIRGFEYAITGDPRWMSQLDSNRYGFHVRPEFPAFNTMDAYGAQMGDSPHGFSYGGEQAVFQPPRVKVDSKKKKRGFFGKKK
ncbi:Gsr1p Ecym_4791 [Eremothecium cymbalariae DBVPG|uniref:Uncharacterized protein n=1 Tax=Eremothecium cymbalariae (strain CBS 270.75 / DBVPG 7215 / KCTC 17166 / NRRL Y-17582) TaxID=931890 RepID=G8JST0_ERECY|nr:hypothetical protein Ecym_4791 [Eremothecium cymbalariae DBVPG\